jgi:hypothetical protein
MTNIMDVIPKGSSCVQRKVNTAADSWGMTINAKIAAFLANSLKT